MSVVPERGYAQCQDATGGTINVSTEASIGPITFLPKEGQEWYIERVAGVWHFERRTLFQNDGVLRSRSGEAGDVIIEAEGRVMIYDKDGKLPGTAEIVDLINNSAPTPDVDEVLIDTPVINSASGSLSVDDLGNPAATVTLQWSVPPSAAFFEMWWSTDGTSLNLGGHSLTGTGDIKGLPPGTEITFRVRATSASGYMSALSEPHTYTTPGFADLAPVPSLPKVDSGAGLIQVTWDGLDAQGSAMPKNVAGVNVSIQDEQDHIASVGTSSASTLFNYTNVVGGQAYYVRLQARTFRGTVSEWTAPISTTAITSVDVQALHDELNSKVTEVSEKINFNRESLSGMQTTAARLQDIADLAEADYQRAVMEYGDNPTPEQVEHLAELEAAADDARRAALLAQEAATRTSPSVESPLEVVRSATEPFTLTAARYHRGDVWIETDTQAPAFEWDDGIWTSVEDINLRPSLEFLTEGRPADLRVYAWDYQPSGANIGDLWIDVGQGNRLHSWDGVEWDAVEDLDRKPLESTLAPVTSRLPIEQSGLFRAFYQSVQPSAPLSNDIWVNGSIVSIYRNGGWNQDPDLAFFTSEDVRGGSTGDGITRIFVQRTTPGDVAAKDAGDLWLDGSTSSKWDGAAWAPVTVPADTWLAALEPYTANRPVGTVTIQYTPEAPTSGDYWMNTSTRALSEWVSGAWSAVQDETLVESVERAGAQQSIQDNQVLIYAQESQPSSPAGVGDFWMDTANGERMLVWDGAQWGTTENVHLSRQTSSIETVLRHMRGTVSTDIEATMRYVARSAGGNSTIYTASTAPNVSGKEVGDLWWQVATEGEGAARIDSIVGQWVWAGDSTGWVKQELRHEVISSVDVGSLVVGGQARIADAVIQKLYAEVVESKVIATKLLAVADFTNLQPDPFFENYTEEYHLEGDWSRDPDDERRLVYWQRDTKQTEYHHLYAHTWVRVIPGQQYLLSFYIQHNGGGYTNLFIDERGPSGTNRRWRQSFRPDSNPVAWSEEFTAPTDGSILWIRFLVRVIPDSESVAKCTVGSPTIRLMNAGELIVDGSIITRKLAAESITSDKIAANAVTADKVNAGAIQAHHLDVVSVAPETQNKLTLNSAGVRLYNEYGNLITEISNTGSNVYQVLAADGTALASISTDGVVSAPEFYAEQYYHDGRPLFGEDGEVDMLPRGLMPDSIGWRDLSGMSRPDASEWGFMEIRAVISANRAYRLTIEPFLITVKSTDTRYLRIRYTTDGSMPTLSSPSWRLAGGRDVGATSGSAGFVTLGGNFFLRGSNILGSDTTTRPVRFLLCVTSVDGIYFPGSGQAEVTAWIEDMGDSRMSPPAGRHRDLYTMISTGGTNSSSDDTSAVKETKSASLAPTSFRSWKGSGAIYTYQSGKMYQGGTAWAGLGVLRSAALFSSGFLSGKYILRASVKFTVSHAYLSAGSSFQVVGHTLTSLPSTKPSVIPLGTIKARSAQTVEFVIPSSFHSRITSGEIKGIGFGNGDTSVSNYGIITASSIRWNVTYTG